MKFSFSIYQMGYVNREHLTVIYRYTLIKWKLLLKAMPYIVIFSSSWAKLRYGNGNNNDGCHFLALSADTQTHKITFQIKRIWYYKCLWHTLFAIALICFYSSLVATETLGLTLVLLLLLLLLLSKSRHTKPDKIYIYIGINSKNKTYVRLAISSS